MTQENKQLLLKDLCARLPYGVICKASHGIGNTDKKHEYIGVLKFVGNCHGVIADYYEDLPHDTGLINNVFYDIEYIKPYLRPMSSMTEEEENDLKKITWQFCFHRKFNVIGVGAADDGGCSLSEMTQIITYLISHHFDCHELIPMGLALEAPEGMYRLINSK